MVQFFLLLTLSSTAFGKTMETVIRHYLPDVLVYDFSRPSRSIRYEIHGWYSADEKGLKERAFFISGQSAVDVKLLKKKISVKTKSQTEVTYMNESKFCALVQRYELDEKTSDFSFREGPKLSDHCGLSSLLEKQIHQMSLVPVKWPTDIESSNGPTHISLPVIRPVADRTDHLSSGRQLIQITPYEIEGEQMSIHIRGVSELPDNKDVEIHGILDWDTRKKMAKRAIWNYRYPGPVSKVGELRAMKIELFQD